MKKKIKSKTKIETETEIKKRTSLWKLRNILGKVIRTVQYERRRIIITTYGMDAVAIVPIEDLELLESISPIKNGRRINLTN